MRSILRPAIAALSLAGLAAIPASGGAYAQAAKQAPAKQAAPAPAAAAPAPAQQAPALKQIALTDKQVEAVLAAQKDLDALTDTLPQDAPAKPDPKVVEQLDDVAKMIGVSS
jgi:hypothetical protein